VRGEQPRLNFPGSSIHPNPHASFSPAVWFVIIALDVSRFNTRPFGRKNTSKNLETSAAV
jgi:hypothetical protein